MRMEPVDGSSRITIGGSEIIAIATDNFLLFPPLRENEGLFACFNKSNSTNFSLTTCTISQENGNITSYLTTFSVEDKNLNHTSLISWSGTFFILAYSSRCSWTVKNSKRASNCGQ